VTSEVRFGYFGVVAVYLTAVAFATQIRQPPLVAAVSSIIMMVAQGLALWGYERSNELPLLGGILLGMLWLPYLLGGLSLGVAVNSLLLLPAALLQLELGLRRLGSHVPKPS
jgi:hypothetical protein